MRRIRGGKKADFTSSASNRLQARLHAVAAWLTGMLLALHTGLTPAADAVSYQVITLAIFNGNPAPGFGAQAIPYSGLNASVRLQTAKGRNPAANCAQGRLFFSIDTPAGKAMYSTLLMAKGGKQPLSNIQFRHTGDVCTLVYIELGS